MTDRVKQQNQGRPGGSSWPPGRSTTCGWATQDWAYPEGSGTGSALSWASIEAMSSSFHPLRYTCQLPSPNAIAGNTSSPGDIRSDEPRAVSAAVARPRDAEE